MLYAAMRAASAPPAAWTAPFTSSPSPLLQNVFTLRPSRLGRLVEVLQLECRGSGPCQMGLIDVSDPWISSEDRSVPAKQPFVSPSGPESKTDLGTVPVHGGC